MADTRRPRTADPRRGEPARLLTHEEVLDLARRFQDLVVRERELQEFLVELKFHGDYAQVIEQRRLHDEALEEIDHIRIQEIVPIVAELNEFLQAVRAEGFATSKGEG